MATTSLDNGIKVPSIDEFMQHPDNRIVSSFFVGSLFAVGICYLARSSFIHALWTLEMRSRRHDASDAEACPQEKRLENQKDEDFARTYRDDACILALNLSFIFASIAQLGSLATYKIHDGGAGCAFFVASSGMASQSSRMIGLFLLSCQLRKYETRFREIIITWVVLGIGLAFVFAMNAISTGTTRDVSVLAISLCYRKQYLPLSLMCSVIFMALELYFTVRFVLFNTPAERTLRHISASFATLAVARPLCLFLLEIITVVPSVIFTNILAEYIPFTVGGIIVIIVFNWKVHPTQTEDLTQVTTGDLCSVIDLRGDRRWTQSMVVPTPFTLHFSEQISQPSHLRDSYRTNHSPIRISVLNNNVGMTDSALDNAGNGVAPAITTPPGASATANVLQVSRRIVASQVQVAEQLNREAHPTGPIVRPMQRPTVAIVIEEGGSTTSEEGRTSPSVIYGSDIIRDNGKSRRADLEVSLSPRSMVASSSFSPRDSRQTWQTRRDDSDEMSPQSEYSPDGLPERTERNSQARHSFSGHDAVISIPPIPTSAFVADFQSESLNKRRRSQKSLHVKVSRTSKGPGSRQTFGRQSMRSLFQELAVASDYFSPLLTSKPSTSSALPPTSPPASASLSVARPSGPRQMIGTVPPVPALARGPALPALTLPQVASSVMPPPINSGGALMSATKSDLDVDEYYYSRRMQ